MERQFRLLFELITSGQINLKWTGEVAVIQIEIFHFKGHLVNYVKTTLDSLVPVCHGHGFKHETVFTYVAQTEIPYDLMTSNTNYSDYRNTV